MKNGSLINTNHHHQLFGFPSTAIEISPSGKASESSTSMAPPSTSSIYQSTSTASSNHTFDGSYLPAYSGSDDEQQQEDNNNNTITDERRRKRMLSNRESARRSRMRKQQHVDDLRAQIVQLTAENNHVLSKFNLASQKYKQLEEENRVLRSYAQDLSNRLQTLGMALQHAGGGLKPWGLDSVSGFYPIA